MSKKKSKIENREGIDCVIELHSDDSDAFAGLGMQAVFNLESTCLLQDRKFTGAIYVRGPRKSVAQVTKLGNIFKTNIHVNHELSPTGRGFEFLVDLVAVYYSLEQDDTLPKLPDGHRAILTVAGTFSLVNHDYLRMSAYGGLTYSRLMHTSNEVSILQE